MLTRIHSLRLYLRPFECSLGRRLSVTDIELLGPIERHRRSGALSPWIVHDRPDRPGSLSLLRKYLRWVIAYTGLEYPEILFQSAPRYPDSYRGCNYDHVVFTRCRFSLHRDRYDRCRRVFIPQLSPGRLFILHFLCAKPPWMSTRANTSRRERAAPTEEDTKTTLREQRHAVVGKSPPAPRCPQSWLSERLRATPEPSSAFTVLHRGVDTDRCI